MGTLKETLQNDLRTALRAHDEVRKTVLRSILTEITNAEKSGKSAVSVNDEKVLQIISKGIKTRTDDAEIYRNAGREETADREIAEAEILETYLPKQLTDTELEEIVQSAVSTAGEDWENPNIGSVMKLVRPQVAGRADNRRVVAIIKDTLYVR